MFGGNSSFILPKLPWLLVLLTLGTASDWAAESLCRIEVVDQSGWPVPLVEFRTTHHLRFVTDNAGLIALDAPELFNRETWFEVIGHSYDAPKDGLGYRGFRLLPRAGQTLRVQVERHCLARRLGRITGGGLLAESQKLGLEQDAPESGVLGCDSVQNAVYHERLFWLWGDTSLARYPLGIFASSGAWSAIRPITKFEPPLRWRLDGIRDSAGAPRGIAPLPGDGPTWLSAVSTIPDRDGHEHLVASYTKIKPPLAVYRAGLCEWDDHAEQFVSLRVLWNQSPDAPNPPVFPEGHSLRWTDPQGRDWLVFGNPLPRLRCPATFAAWQDPGQWESLTPPVSLPSANDGRAVRPHSGAVGWHPWRKCWVAVFVEAFGQPSDFGEVWYAEADSPLGPWGPAVKILSHENQTFYNPALHLEWSAADSPRILFEGTYTQQFTRHGEATPRYEYNQMLYRLDLDDPGLAAAHRR